MRACTRLPAERKEGVVFAGEQSTKQKVSVDNFLVSVAGTSRKSVLVKFRKGSIVERQEIVIINVSEFFDCFDYPRPLRQ